MLICRVESDIFGNRAAVLVPGHCRTRIPFFFLSFIIMIGPINLGLAVIPPFFASLVLVMLKGSLSSSLILSGPRDRPGQWVREPGLRSHQSVRGAEPVLEAASCKSLMGLGIRAGAILCQLAHGHLGHDCQTSQTLSLTSGPALPLSSQGHGGFCAIVL